MYLAEKVILHPDLEGVPLLILANKQDKLVRAHLISTFTYLYWYWWLCFRMLCH